MDYRERGSHAQGVDSIQYSSRMGTVRKKQQEETDTRIMQESFKKSGRNKRGHEGEKFKTRANQRKDLTIEHPEGEQQERNVVTNGKSPKQGLTSTKDLTIELPEGRKSLLYNRLD